MNDQKLQNYYNQLFALVSERMHKVSFYDKIRSYGYHFIYLLGIAYWLNPVRAENYRRVLGRVIRYLRFCQNSR
jgi:hypothetical protein